MLLKPIEKLITRVVNSWLQQYVKSYEDVEGKRQDPDTTSLYHHAKQSEVGQLGFSQKGGSFCVSNLQLRHDALDFLNLPIQLTEGFIGRLKINLPFSVITSEPAEIEIDRLVLHCVSDYEWDINRFDAVRLSRKFAKLQAAELLLLQEHPSLGEDSGLGSSWLSNILDNLRISIKCVQIVIIDPVVKVQCSIESITFVPTNEDWKPAYLKTRETEAYLHKLLIFDGICLETIDHEASFPIIENLKISVQMRQSTESRNSDDSALHIPGFQATVLIEDSVLQAEEEQVRALLLMASKYLKFTIPDLASQGSISKPTNPPLKGSNAILSWRRAIKKVIENNRSKSARSWRFHENYLNEFRIYTKHYCGRLKGQLSKEMVKTLEEIEKVRSIEQILDMREFAVSNHTGQRQSSKLFGLIGSLSSYVSANFFVTTSEPSLEKSEASKSIELPRNVTSALQAYVTLVCDSFQAKLKVGNQTLDTVLRGLHVQLKAYDTYSTFSVILKDLESFTGPDTHNSFRIFQSLPKHFSEDVLFDLSIKSFRGDIDRIHISASIQPFILSLSEAVLPFVEFGNQVKSADVENESVRPHEMDRPIHYEIDCYIDSPRIDIFARYHCVILSAGLIAFTSSPCSLSLEDSVKSNISFMTITENPNGELTGLQSVLDLKDARVFSKNVDGTERFDWCLPFDLKIRSFRRFKCQQGLCQFTELSFNSIPLHLHPEAINELVTDFASIKLPLMESDSKELKYDPKSCTIYSTLAVSLSRVTLDLYDAGSGSPVFRLCFQDTVFNVIQDRFETLSLHLDVSRICLENLDDSSHMELVGESSEIDGLSGSKLLSLSITQHGKVIKGKMSDFNAVLDVPGIVFFKGIADLFDNGNDDTGFERFFHIEDYLGKVHEIAHPETSNHIDIQLTLTVSSVSVRFMVESDALVSLSISPISILMNSFDCRLSVFDVALIDETEEFKSFNVDRKILTRRVVDSDMFHELAFVYDWHRGFRYPKVTVELPSLRFQLSLHFLKKLMKKKVFLEKLGTESKSVDCSIDMLEISFTSFRPSFAIVNDFENTKFPGVFNATLETLRFTKTIKLSDPGTLKALVEKEIDYIVPFQTENGLPFICYNVQCKQFQIRSRVDSGGPACMVLHPLDIAVSYGALEIGSFELFVDRPKSFLKCQLSECFFDIDKEELLLFSEIQPVLTGFKSSKNNEANSLYIRQEFDLDTVYLVDFLIEMNMSKVRLTLSNRQEDAYLRCIFLCSDVCLKMEVRKDLTCLSFKMRSFSVANGERRVVSQKKETHTFCVVEMIETWQKHSLSFRIGSIHVSIMPKFVSSILQFLGSFDLSSTEENSASNRKTTEVTFQMATSDFLICFEDRDSLGIESGVSASISSFRDKFGSQVMFPSLRCYLSYDDALKKSYLSNSVDIEISSSNSNLKIVVSTDVSFSTSFIDILRIMQIVVPFTAVLMSSGSKSKSKSSVEVYIASTGFVLTNDVSKNPGPLLNISATHISFTSSGDEILLSFESNLKCWSKSNWDSCIETFSFNLSSMNRNGIMETTVRIPRFALNITKPNLIVLDSVNSILTRTIFPRFREMIEKGSSNVHIRQNSLMSAFIFQNDTENDLQVRCDGIESILVEKNSKIQIQLIQIPKTMDILVCGAEWDTFDWLQRVPLDIEVLRLPLRSNCSSLKAIIHFGIVSTEEIVIVSAKSPVVVRNNINADLTLFIQREANFLQSFPLSYCDSCSLPLHLLMSDTRMHICKENNLNSNAQSFPLESFLSYSETAPFSFRCVADEPFWISVKGSQHASDNFYEIILETPFILKNLLPHDFRVLLCSEETQVVYQLQKESCIDVFQLDCERDLSIYLSLAESPEKFEISLPENEVDLYQVVHFDSLETDLYLKFIRYHQRILEIVIFAPFVIRNCSNLDIIVAETFRNRLLLLGNQDLRKLTPRRSPSFEHQIRENIDQSSSIPWYFFKDCRIETSRKGIPVLTRDENLYKETVLVFSPRPKSFLEDQYVISLCTRDTQWCKPIDLSILEGSRSVFLESSKSFISHTVELGVHVDVNTIDPQIPMRVVTITSRLVVRNLTTKTLSISQFNCPKTTLIPLGCESALHPSDSSKDLLYTIKINEYGWEYSGRLDLYQCGVFWTRMVNPFTNQSKFMRISSQSIGPGVIVHLEFEEHNVPYRIENFTYLPMSIEQKGVNEIWKRYTVLPYHSQPFVWDEPFMNQKVLISSNSFGRLVIGEFPLDKIHQYPAKRIAKRRTSKFLSEEIKVSVVAEGSQRVLRIFDTKLGSKGAISASTQKISICVEIETFGISLITSRTSVSSSMVAVSREMCHITLDGAKFSYGESEGSQDVKLCVDRVQIDESDGRFVLVSDIDLLGNRRAIEFSISKNLQYSTNDSLYISFCSLSVESFRIRLREAFLKSVINFVSNLHLSSMQQQSHSSSSMGTMYIQSLQISPINLILSYTSSRISQSPMSNESPLSLLLQSLKSSLVNIEEAPIAFDAIALRDRFVLVDDSLSLIIDRYKSQLLRESLKVIGSVSFLGNPVGLVSRIQKGITDLVHEPMKELFNRPLRVHIGVFRGLSSFMLNSLYGFSNFGEKMSKSVTKAISTLVFGTRLDHVDPLTSIYTGLKMFIRLPFLGLYHDGVIGFARGLVAGTTGILLVPVAGVSNWINFHCLALCNVVDSETRIEAKYESRWFPRGFMVLEFNQLDHALIREIVKNHLAVGEDFIDCAVLGQHIVFISNRRILVFYALFVDHVIDSFELQTDLEIEDIRCALLQGNKLVLIHHSEQQLFCQVSSVEYHVAQRLIESLNWILDGKND